MPKLSYHYHNHQLPSSLTQIFHFRNQYLLILLLFPTFSIAAQKGFTLSALQGSADGLTSRNLTQDISGITLGYQFGRLFGLEYARLYPQHGSGQLNQYGFLYNFYLNKNAQAFFTFGLGDNQKQNQKDNFLAYGLGMKVYINDVLSLRALYSQLDTDNSNDNAAVILIGLEYIWGTNSNE